VTPIRVLLADDHETVRQGLRLLIDEQTDMTVVGEAGDGRDAVVNARTLAPDVVVLDVSMPGMNGLEATKVLRGHTPAPAIVALTRYRDEAYVRELVAAGAAAYVLKQSASSELLRAIRAAASGRPYLDSAINASGTWPSSRERRTRTQPPITDREGEVLRMMAVGHSNKEIAAALDVSVKTVEVHKANAMRKLGLSGRIDVVRYAVLQGWLEEP
jgi:DNA-binding NarL/FixJ family response regulator